MTDTKQFFAYPTTNLAAPGLTDEAKAEHCHIWRDLKTVRGAARRMRDIYPGKTFKIFEFHNIYDNRTFRLAHAGR